MPPQGPPQNQRTRGGRKAPSLLLDEKEGLDSWMRCFSPLGFNIYFEGSVWDWPSRRTNIGCCPRELAKLLDNRIRQIHQTPALGRLDPARLLQRLHLAGKRGELSGRAVTPAHGVRGGAQPHL